MNKKKREFVYVISCWCCGSETMDPKEWHVVAQNFFGHFKWICPGCDKGSWKATVEYNSRHRKAVKP